MTLSCPVTLSFVGETTDLDGFVWYGDGVLLRNSEAPIPMLGAEDVVGVADGDHFVYGALLATTDNVYPYYARSVYSHHGVLMQEEQQAPGFPAGATISDVRGAAMTNDGRAYWLADVSGPTGFIGPVLYTAADASPSNIEVFLAPGDVIDGATIDQFDFSLPSFQFSGNGEHFVLNPRLDTDDPEYPGIMVVDGMIVAQGGAPVSGGAGELWNDFKGIAINNAGNYLFSGDVANAPPGTAAFVAYNSEIVLRGGDILDGVPLGVQARAVALNDLNQAVVIWRQASSRYTVFFACDAADMRGTARRLMTTGDPLDLDGDGQSDATLGRISTEWDDFPRLLTNDGRIYLEADLAYSNGDLRSIIEIQPGECPCALSSARR